MTKLTEKHVAEYIGILRANYEGSYKTKDKTQEALLIASWLGILGEYPKELVDRAVLTVIRNSTVVPRVGHIVQACEELMTAGQPTAVELWNELTQALRLAGNVSYYFDFPANAKAAMEMARNAYNGLAQECKVFVGDFRQFLQMAMDADAPKYEKGRFLAAVGDIRANLMRKPDFRNKMLTSGRFDGLLLGGGAK